MDTYEFGPFRLDTCSGILLHGSEPVVLGHRAVALLRALVQRPGALVSKDALIEAAWPGQAVEDSNLPVQIAALRRALGTAPGGDRWIETMPRRGYRFIGPVVAQKENSVILAPPQADSARVPVTTPHAEAERRQTPSTQAEPIETPHLNLLPEHVALSDAHPLRLDARQAEAGADFETAEKLWRQVIAVLPVDSEAYDAVRPIAPKDAAAPAPTPVYEGRRSPAASSGGAVRLARRRLLALGGLGAAGVGAIAAVPLVRSTPIRAPRCLGSAAMVIRVSAEALNRMS
jgi:DNA-binding winged helix-turn-helix (wHTH) protein